MNRISFLFLPLSAIGVSACSSSKAKEEVKRPNIIFMMTDDHTTQAMSCYGGRLLNCAMPESCFVVEHYLEDKEPERETDYYYVRVRQRDQQWAWSSLIWVERI